MSSQDTKRPDAERAGQPAPGADPGDALYQGLEPHLEKVSPEEFKRLLASGLVQALGLGGQPAAAPAPAPEAEPAPSQPPQAAPAAVPPLGPPVAMPLAPTYVFSGQAEPPPLPPEEQALEASLVASINPQYQDEEWWLRTIRLMATWNQMRRRLGHLSPQFQQIGPHWRQPEWADFNLARRQADGQGADYDLWMAAQFQRPGLLEQMQAPLPQELHGPEAQRAWHNLLQARRRLGQGESETPPYTNETFDLYNPQHVSYAQVLLDEITSLASHVYADDPDGPAILLAQALERGNLPLMALELVPQLRDRVLRLARPAAPPA